MTKRVEARTAASQFIRENYRPSDRLALVLIRRQNGETRQRLATAERIASAAFLEALEERNAEGFDVYLSMNTLKASATGRTKVDVGEIRHIYLDLDDDGPERLQRLGDAPGLPAATFVVNTSPGKYQVIWKVEGFTLDQAENLQRSMAREFGADLSATDSTRVLRLPGFVNHKYPTPFVVTAEQRATTIVHPDAFIVAAPPTAAARHTNRPSAPRGSLSQSERDWAFARRSLARGEPPGAIAAAIATYRRFEKSDPVDYAERTVRKAAESLSHPVKATGRSEGPIQNEASVQVER